MGTTPLPGDESYHEFHAEAHLVSGELEHPVKQKIERHTRVALKDRKGGHLTRFTEDANIEGLVSFKRGNTRVSGSTTTKKDPANHGWITLATSVVERLNIVEVITADRIVSQVSTDHPFKDGHFPHVTFLGSHFDNLRVNGVTLRLKLNLDVCGQRAKDNTSYLSKRDFLDRARGQVAKVAEASSLSEKASELYPQWAGQIDTLLAGKREGDARVRCSIVEKIENVDEIPIPGVRAFGHVLIIPNFGIVALGEVEVSETLDAKSEPVGNYFELHMIRAHLGCVAGGTVNGAAAAANGQSGPPKK